MKNTMSRKISALLKSLGSTYNIHLCKSKRGFCLSPSGPLLIGIGKEDRFNCIHVDLGDDNQLNDFKSVGDDHLFTHLLSESLQRWKWENRTAIWLKFPTDFCHLIPLATNQGFELHHAQGRHVVMSCWLRQGASRLPRYASHQIGVAGFVLNEETEEVLMVQEKHRLVRWKFPGGLSNPGEDIQDTALREVMEETGLQTEFKSVLSFRQQHNHPGAFGCSDIYVVCRLSPLTFDIRICPSELEDVRWMKVVDLVATKEGHTPLTVRMGKLALFGLREGFDRIDITVDELPSIYNSTYKLFHRPLVVK